METIVLAPKDKKIREAMLQKAGDLGYRFSNTIYGNSINSFLNLEYGNITFFENKKNCYFGSIEEKEGWENSYIFVGINTFLYGDMK